uniref:NAD-specific glutamate dehydrogenase n=1 Tax=Parastrongyloides trichosuri TaxID=131310 RepID=A0A0N4Z557_PARTI
MHGCCRIGGLEAARNREVVGTTGFVEGVCAVAGAEQAFVEDVVDAGGELQIVVEGVVCAEVDDGVGFAGLEIVCVGDRNARDASGTGGDLAVVGRRQGQAEVFHRFPTQGGVDGVLGHQREWLAGSLVFGLQDLGDVGGPGQGFEHWDFQAPLDAGNNGWAAIFPLEQVAGASGWVRPTDRVVAGRDAVVVVVVVVGRAGAEAIDIGVADADFLVQADFWGE